MEIRDICIYLVALKGELLYYFPEKGLYTFSALQVIGKYMYCCQDFQFAALIRVQ